MAGKTRTILFLSVVALVLAPSAAEAQQASVSAVDNEFNPAQLKVEAGTTVTWTNNGDAPHTVTASDGSFDSGNLNPGQTFRYTFDEAGEFPYICEYHEADGMVGSITVAQTDDAGSGGGGGRGNGGGGRGNGGGGRAGGNGGNGDDPTEPGDDDALPATGPSGLGAFAYVGFVLIAAGSTCLYLDRRPATPQAGSLTQSRVR